MITNVLPSHLVAMEMIYDISDIKCYIFLVDRLITFWCCVLFLGVMFVCFFFFFWYVKPNKDS